MVVDFANRTLAAVAAPLNDDLVPVAGNGKQVLSEHNPA